MNDTNCLKRTVGKIFATVSSNISVEYSNLFEVMLGGLLMQPYLQQIQQYLTMGIRSLLTGIQHFLQHTQIRILSRGESLGFIQENHNRYQYLSNVYQSKSQTDQETFIDFFTIKVITMNLFDKFIGSIIGSERQKFRILLEIKEIIQIFFQPFYQTPVKQISQLKDKSQIINKQQNQIQAKVYFFCGQEKIDSQKPELDDIQIYQAPIDYIQKENFSHIDNLLVTKGHAKLKSQEIHQAQELKLNQIYDLAAQNQLLNEAKAQKALLICTQIFQIKRKIESITLYKSEQKLKTIKQLTQQKIRDEIEKLVFTQAIQIQILQNQLEALKSYVEDRCLNSAQFCKSHQSIVFYKCKNDYLKYHTYLCNQCLLQISQNNLHENHQIICKTHKHIIKYKCAQNSQKAIINKQLNQTTQIFLCDKCLELVSPCDLDSIKHVSRCHFSIITETCVDFQCIKNNDFMRCHHCNCQKHQNHKKISFKKDKLMEHFMLKKQQNISLFEQIFINIRQKLNLHPLKKCVDSHIKQILFMINLSPFQIYNNVDVEKLIDSVLNGRQIDSMLVLCGIRNLQLKNYDQIKRCYFLEVLNDFVQEEVQSLTKKFSNQLNLFSQKMQAFIDQMTDQNILRQLQRKYEKITNIQHQYISQINPLYLNFVRHIQVKQRFQDIYNEKIASKWKNQRATFFSQYIKEKLEQYQLDKQQKKKIIKFIVEQKQAYINQQKDLQKHRTIIKDLFDYLRKFEQKFHNKARQCHTLEFILEHKLTLLKSVKIQYQAIAFAQSAVNYSISAYTIFKILHLNKKIQSLQIQGVKISSLQLFIKQYRVVKQNLKRKYTTKTFQYFQINEDNENIYLLDQSKQQQQDWLKIFNHSSEIMLSLDADLNFNFDSKIVLDQISHFEFISNDFPFFGNLYVKIQLAQFGIIHRQQNALQLLLKILIRIKRLKLIIRNSGYDPFNQTTQILYSNILGSLIYFNELQGLTFQRFIFNQQFQKTQFQLMERNLAITFKKNHISHLELFYCKRFPRFPIIKTLQILDIRDSSFWKQSGLVSQATHNSPFLKYIRCNLIVEKNNVNFDLKNIRAVSLSYNKWLTDSLLQRLQCQHILFLTITGSNQHKVTAGSLRQTFPKMRSLTCLSLKLIDCSGEVLVTISSTNLEQINLQSNNSITNQCLQGIDRKWPFLTNLALCKLCCDKGRCEKINGRMLSICRFRGLFKLRIDEKMMYESDYTMHALKYNGIKVKTS